MYDLGKDPTHAEQLRMFYQREFEVLRQLRSTGLAPEAHDPFLWSDDFFILPIEPPAGHALSARPLPETRDELVQELLIAEACFTGLSHIHKQGILHRALGPDVIHMVKEGDKPKIQFTNFFAARLDERSIALSLDLLELEDPYANPLLAGSYGLATGATDCWSLALIFLVRFTRLSGAEARAALVQRQEYPGLSATWSSLPTDIVTDLDALLQSLLEPDSSTPPPTAEEDGRQFGELARRLKAEVSHDREHIFDGRYKVHRVLGKGAMACTYQVTDVQTDVIIAVKQFFQPAAVYDQVKAEYQALVNMRSKYLPNIMHVQEPEKDAHVIMEYIPGVTLDELSAEFPWPLERWWEFAQQILTAIEELEQRELLHRDIKPANIIIHEQGGHAVLIDFGFAVDLGKPQRFAGTPLYLPPEALTTDKPPPSTDRYAAAVVLFKILTGSLPFQFDSPGTRTLVAPDTNDERVQRLCSALLRALDPDPTQRYSSVQTMQEALQQAMQMHTIPSTDESPQRSDRINPWVDNLRGLYRSSGRGNADNRGLDSDFVRTTYVETALDTHLLPALFTNHPRAVFLSGNPGDGKTAFLAQVQATLEQQGAERIQHDASGWEMLHNGHTFRSCYDASESHAGTSADEQLTARMHELAGETAPDAPITVLVAINDGRLVDYFTRQQARFGWLATQIEQARQATALDQLPVWVVDLKQRAFVHLPHQTQPSVLQRVLQCLIDESQWEICHDCASQAVCPIQHNAAALRNSAIRERLEYLLLITHLRQQRHTTMRDLRSALSYLITSNIGCEAVHKQRQNNDAGIAMLHRSYWNIAFHPLETGDELLNDMTILDPARYPHPRLDRFLYFHQRGNDTTLCQLFTNGEHLDRLPFAHDQDWMDAVKRRLYFESVEHPAPETTQEEPVPEIVWQALLPYQHAGEFLAILQEQADLPHVTQTIAAGMLHSEGIIGQNTDGFLTTTVSHSAPQQLLVLKQIPLTEFRLWVIQPENRAGIETIPELLVFEHTSGTPRLELTIDLFELLLRMAAGLRPDSPEFRPLLEDIVPFKSELLLQTTRDLVLIESQYRIHSITQHDGKIIRQQDPEVHV
jgi:serine/threonine protein kinase